MGSKAREEISLENNLLCVCTKKIYFLFLGHNIAVGKEIFLPK